MCKFTKDVFIQNLEIINYDKRDDHTTYLIKVIGRTKYLNIKKM
jgi:hypothetical protein